MSKKFRLTVKKLYEELRRAEWEGKTLNQFLDALELKHPDLQETDAELEARFANVERKDRAH